MKMNIQVFFLIQSFPEKNIRIVTILKIINNHLHFPHDRCLAHNTRNKINLKRYEYPIPFASITEKESYVHVKLFLNSVEKKRPDKKRSKKISSLNSLYKIMHDIKIPVVLKLNVARYTISELNEFNVKKLKTKISVIINVLLNIVIVWKQ